MKTTILFIIPFFISCSNQQISHGNEIERTAQDFIEGKITKSKAENQIENYGFENVNIYLNEQHPYATIDSTISIQIQAGRLAPFSENSKYYLYDFAYKARNIGNDTLIHASYTRTQLNERWYIEEVGFD